MTLLERSQNLRQRIERHGDVRRAHKQAEALRARVTEVKTSRDSLSAALAKMNVLATKAGIPAKKPDASTALTTLEEYRADLKDIVADMGKQYTRFKRSLEKVTKEVVSSVEKALATSKRDLPSIDEAFLKQVERIPAYEAKVALIRKERDRLLEEADLDAMTADELGAFLDQRDKLKAHADSLQITEFPEEVLEFFAAARRAGGAPLEKLTDKVREWLNDRDQLKNVRVTVIAR